METSEKLFISTDDKENADNTYCRPSYNRQNLVILVAFYDNCDICMFVLQNRKHLSRHIDSFHKN